MLSKSCASVSRANEPVRAPPALGESILLELRADVEEVARTGLRPAAASRSTSTDDSRYPTAISESSEQLVRARSPSPRPCILLHSVVASRPPRLAHSHSHPSQARIVLGRVDILECAMPSVEVRSFLSHRLVSVSVVPTTEAPDTSVLMQQRRMRSQSGATCDRAHDVLFMRPSSPVAT